MIYLRAPGVDGLCHDCDADDPCAGGGVIYLPCANQCGVPSGGDQSVVLPHGTPDFAMVKVNGVKAVYYKGSVTDDALYGDLQEDLVSSCPSEVNYCFSACCTDGGKPAKIIISSAQFASLFPGVTPPTSSSYPLNLCIKWEYCYYCSCIPCVNPVSSEAASSTAAEAWMDFCTYWEYPTYPGKITKEAQELCLHCVGCNSCEPAMNWRYTVTIAGCTGSFSIYNGTWSLRWDGGCTWRIEDDYFPDDGTLLLLQWNGTAWQVSGSHYEPMSNGSYGKSWQGGSNPCNPAGSFAALDCSCDPYYGCTPGSCEGSVGATCIVS